MSLHLIRFLRRWHRRFGHPVSYPLQLRAGHERITVGLLCTCGELRPVEGIIVRRKQAAILEIEEVHAG